LGPIAGGNRLPSTIQGADKVQPGPATFFS
jgi:hypothetical protein